MKAQFCGYNAPPLAPKPVHIDLCGSHSSWHGNWRSTNHVGGRHVLVEPVLSALPGAAEAAETTQKPSVGRGGLPLPSQGPTAAGGATASSAAAAVAARRRQRKLLLQQQQQQRQHEVNAADADHATEQEHEQEQQHEEQQQDRWSDAQLKPALQQLLQQLQEAHSSVQLHQHQYPQQQQQQQDLTAVAQLTEMIQRLRHPKQLLTVLLVGRGALNVVHLTSAASVLVRLAQQTQHMQQDPAYRTKVSRSRCCLCQVLSAAVLHLLTVHTYICTFLALVMCPANSCTHHVLYICMDIMPSLTCMHVWRLLFSPVLSPDHASFSPANCQVKLCYPNSLQESLSIHSKHLYAVLTVFPSVHYAFFTQVKVCYKQLRE
jgi:hypothetical protein